jgi:hypothetical protein
MEVAFVRCMGHEFVSDQHFLLRLLVWAVFAYAYVQLPYIPACLLSSGRVNAVWMMALRCARDFVWIERMLNNTVYGDFQHSLAAKLLMSIRNLRWERSTASSGPFLSLQWGPLLPFRLTAVTIDGMIASSISASGLLLSVICHDLQPHLSQTHKTHPRLVDEMHHCGIRRQLRRDLLQLDVPNDETDHDSKSQSGKLPACCLLCQHNFHVSIRKTWVHLPKQPRGPAPKPCIGPARLSKLSLPVSGDVVSHRSGLKAPISAGSHDPTRLLFSCELLLRLLSSTSIGGAR